MTQEFHHHWLKKQILIPLTLVMVSLLALFLFAFNRHVVSSANNAINRDLRGIQTFWEVQSQQRVNSLSAILSLITRHEGLRSGLQQKCYRTLLRYGDQVFADLNDTYRITSLTFLDEQRRNLLRIHDFEPADTNRNMIGRFTAQQAASTGRIAVAWEFDRAGELALRAVIPWHHEGKLLGYVEVAQGIHKTLHNLDDLFDLTHLVVVTKQYLSEIGLDQLSQVYDMPVQWSRYPDVLVLHRSSSTIPPVLDGILQKSNWKEGVEGLEFAFNGRYFSTRVLPLPIGSGGEVGHIIALRDVTGARRAYTNVLGLVNLGALILVAFLVWLFYKITSRTEHKLARSYEELQASHRAVALAHQEWVASFDAIREPIFLHDEHYRVIRANRAYRERTGLPAEQIIGRPYYEIFPRNEGPLSSCKKALQDPAGELEEEEIRLATGETFLSRSFFVRDTDNQYQYSVHILEDITVRQHMEAALRKENRAYRTVSQSNQALIHAEEEGQLLQEICDTITGIGGYRLAWVGFKRDDLTKNIEPKGYSGISEEELIAQHLSWHGDFVNDCAAPCQAILTGQPHMIGNVLEASDFPKLQASAQCLSFASLLALPLHDEGQVFGVLTICAAEPDAFDDREIKLLSELADDISYGTVALRTRAERAQAEHERLRMLQRLDATLSNTVQAMGNLLEVRDPYTAGHQQRVARLATALGEEMHLSEERLHALTIASTLHDIGKIYVPAEILSKPGKLNNIEMSLVKTHPEVGHKILKPIDFPWPVAEIVLQHHEHLDGSGYPYGLVGDDILLEARILTVADVVESLSSHRPYRPTMGLETALEELSRLRGSFYDPQVVDACMALFKRKGYRMEAA